MKLSTRWQPFNRLTDFTATREELSEQWLDEVRTARLEVAGAGPTGPRSRKPLSFGEGRRT